MMTTILRGAAAGLALAAGLAGAAMAADANRLLQQISPQDVAGVLDELGIAYAIEPDPRGLPMIQVDTSPFPAAQFNILFFACDDVAAACDDITLWSWYDADGEKAQAAINAWNDPFQGSRRWSTGYLDDESDPALILNINATGGIGEQNLQILMNTYVEDMFAFEEALAGGQVADAGDTGAEGEARPVLTAALLDAEIAQLTRQVKDYGADAFSHTKQTDKK